MKVCKPPGQHTTFVKQLAFMRSPLLSRATFDHFLAIGLSACHHKLCIATARLVTIQFQVFTYVKRNYYLGISRMMPRLLENRKRRSRQQLIAATAKIIYRTTDISTPPCPFLVETSVPHGQYPRPTAMAQARPRPRRSAPRLLRQILAGILKQAGADEMMRFTYTRSGNRVTALTIESTAFTHQDGTVLPP